MTEPQPDTAAAPVDGHDDDVAPSDRVDPDQFPAADDDPGEG